MPEAGERPVCSLETSSDQEHPAPHSCYISKSKTIFCKNFRQVDVVCAVMVQTLQRKSRRAEYRLVIPFRVGEKTLILGKKMFVAMSASGKG